MGHEADVGEQPAVRQQCGGVSQGGGGESRVMRVKMTQHIRADYLKVADISMLNPWINLTGQVLGYK